MAIDALIACGGRTTSANPDGVGVNRGEAGADSGSGSGSGGSSGMECMVTGGGSGGTLPGSTSCSTSMFWRCPDGNTYGFDCSCPAAMCTCTVTPGDGGMGHGMVVDYAGCSSCLAPGDCEGLPGFMGP